jgi:hypothetical protein
MQFERPTIPTESGGEKSVAEKARVLAKGLLRINKGAVAALAALGILSAEAISGSKNAGETYPISAEAGQQGDLDMSTLSAAVSEHVVKNAGYAVGETIFDAADMLGIDGRVFNARGDGELAPVLLDEDVAGTNGTVSFLDIVSKHYITFHTIPAGFEGINYYFLAREFAKVNGVEDVNAPFTGSQVLLPKQSEQK